MKFDKLKFFWRENRGEIKEGFSIMLLMAVCLKLFWGSAVVYSLSSDVAAATTTTVRITTTTTTNPGPTTTTLLPAILGYPVHKCTGWLEPEAVIQPTLGGVACAQPWTNPANGKIEDGNTALWNASINVQSCPLMGYNFNPNIPSNAINIGIEVKVKRGANSLPAGAGVMDYQVSLAWKNSTNGLVSITTTNLAKSNLYSPSLTWVNYGSDNQTWGVNWNYASANNASLGLLFKSQTTGLTTLKATYVDDMQARFCWDSRNMITIKGKPVLTGKMVIT